MQTWNWWNLSFTRDCTWIHNKLLWHIFFTIPFTESSLRTNEKKFSRNPVLNFFLHKNYRTGTECVASLSTLLPSYFKPQSGSWIASSLPCLLCYLHDWPNKEKRPSLCVHLISPFVHWMLSQFLFWLASKIKLAINFSVLMCWLNCLQPLTTRYDIKFHTPKFNLHFIFKERMLNVVHHKRLILVTLKLRLIYKKTLVSEARINSGFGVVQFHREKQKAQLFID